MKTAAVNQTPLHNHYEQYIDRTWIKLALLLEGFRKDVKETVIGSEITSIKNKEASL